MTSLIGKRVLVVRNIHSGDYTKNNDKYLGLAYDKPVKIVHKVGELYITDFFVPEFMNENNDYIYYGFLKIMDSDFKTINE